MSRHYNKSSSRKMSAVCTTSIQFDTLFKENSNRPSAAKSAGTVGKWGVTSFTSIRGTNVLSGNNGTVGAKRGRADSSSNDAFAFDNDSDGAPPPIAKPKKFFKSRNAEPIPLSAESKASAGAVYSTNITDDSETPIRPMRTAASRKMVSGTPSPPESRASTSSMGAETESSKPPIVLRIFKGTSQLITTPSTPTSPEDEFDLHLVDEVDTGTSSSRGKQSSTGRGKRTKERRERSRDESPETETVLRVNTAMSRAQRYSRRQAAIENSENESDHVTPIPVPKKAARGRIAAETMENDPSPASKYNLYASPAGNSSSHEDEPETESPESHSYNNSSSQLDYNSEPAQLTQMTSTISTARNELHTSMVPSPALPDAFMETDSPTPDRQTDYYSEAEEEEQQQQPEVDYVKPTPGAQLCEQRGEENVKGLSTELYTQEETPEPQQELYSQPELYSRIEAQEGYGRQEPSELYNRSEPTDLYSQAEPTDLYGSAETGAGAHYSRGESVAHYTRSESNEHYGRMEPGVTGSTTHYGQVQPTDPFSRTGPSTISNEAFVSSQQNAYVDPSQSVEDVESLQPTAVEPGSVEQFEHMTARERFARRNRNAAESSSTAAASGVELSFGNPDSCADSFANGSEAGSGGGSSSGPSVVTRKKGSIFKSRALQGSEDNKKRLALYKHKWCDNQDGSGPGTSQPNMSNADATNPSADPAKPSTSAFDMPDDDEDDFGLRRVTSYPKNNTDSSDNPETVTSVKCSRDTKGFYTVVRNVKKAHQIQESGEFQEFNDDVEYILDALQEQNPIGTRCLSAITLASKCMVPAFRMHVRAHGTVAKFFKALNDSARDQSLGLCTATVMFALSQDRLNMDLDRDSLELMLNLLESDASHRNALEDCGLSSTQLWKNKQKVRELCAEIQSQGHAKHLNLDNITVGQLAMETLLSLTSRRAGEWFKEELRELGGLEHIVRTICQCSGQVDDYVVEWTDSLLDRMRKIDRCLRVLENVTQHNEENQMYLLRYMDGALVDVLVRLLRLCGNEVPLYPVYDATDKESTGVVIREALLAVLKVLINLSHDFKGQTYGSTVVGAKEGLLMSSLHMLLHIPSYIVEEKKFDLTVLALTLMINLVEHNAANRLMLINTKAPAEVENMFASEKSAVEALIGMFYRQEEFAKTEEAKTDAILDGKDDDTADDKGKQDKSAGSSQNRMQSQNQEVGPKGAQTGEEDDENEEDDGKEKESKKDKTKNKSQDEFIEETVAKLLAKAGRHMEHTFVAAYIALLLGYVIMDNKTHEDIVRHYIPEHNFKIMVAVLQKFFNFMNLTVTATGSSRGLAATETVIKYMAKIDEPPAPALDESRSEGDLPSDDLDGSISS